MNLPDNLTLAGHTIQHRGPDGAHVSPHEFSPLQRFFNKGRCRHCHLHERVHPVKNWTWARPLGDRGLPVR